MFCNKCGHEIEDDSKFCNNCGEKIINDNTDDDKKDMINMGKFFFIALIVIAIAIPIAMLIKEASNDGSITDIFSEKATNEDLYMNIINSIDGDYIYIQANEKIKDLVIEVYYLDKNGTKLKTEVLEIGNVTPGNDYQYKLSKSGMQIKDLDKLSKYSYKITEGTIVK